MIQETKRQYELLLPGGAWTGSERSCGLLLLLLLLLLLSIIIIIIIIVIIVIVIVIIIIIRQAIVTIMSTITADAAQGQRKRLSWTPHRPVERSAFNTCTDKTPKSCRDPACHSL